MRKWKKAADANLEGNKADEKADENVVKNAKESSMRKKYQPKKLLEVDVRGLSIDSSNVDSQYRRYRTKFEDGMYLDANTNKHLAKCFESIDSKFLSLSAFLLEGFKDRLNYFSNFQPFNELSPHSTAQVSHSPI